MFTFFHDCPRFIVVLHVSLPFYIFECSMFFINFLTQIFLRVRRCIYFRVDPTFDLFYYVVVRCHCSSQIFEMFNPFNVILTDSYVLSQSVSILCSTYTRVFGFNLIPPVSFSTLLKISFNFIKMLRARLYRLHMPVKFQVHFLRRV